jgi:hypothetical protein
MRHDRLAQLMQAHREAMNTDPEHDTTLEAILSVFSALDKREVTEGRALHLLGYQALRLTDEPTHAALYRQAEAEIRQMQRAAQGTGRG